VAALADAACEAASWGCVRGLLKERHMRWEEAEKNYHGNHSVPSQEVKTRDKLLGDVQHQIVAL
jgi:hypothetical protein